jgi:hypothetical protein
MIPHRTIRLMKTAEEFLNDKFNGKGYEFKIHDWINGQVSNYSPCELLEEYAQQNTLNRDKVKATLVKDFMIQIHGMNGLKKSPMTSAPFPCLL